MRTYMMFMRTLSIVLFFSLTISISNFSLAAGISTNERYAHTIEIIPKSRYVLPDESVVVTVKVFHPNKNIVGLIAIDKLLKMDPEVIKKMIKGKPVIGADIELVTDKGVLSSIKDNLDGSYSATFTGDDSGGTALITSTYKVDNSVKKIGITLLPDENNEMFKAKVALGKKIFNDVNLSNPVGQSCASCHSAEAAFVDPDKEFPTSEGVLAGSTFGNRNTPTVRYAALIPEQHIINGTTFGGLFWDGRAKNSVEQAKQPFLNPLEMNQPDGAAVVEQVRRSAYAQQFLDIFGEGVFSNKENSFEYIAQSLAAFQQSSEMSPFSSKFDAVQRGDAEYTETEARGAKIFTKAKCDTCHSTPPNKGAQLFSNFEYMTIGAPANPKSKFIEKNKNFIDYGRGVVTQKQGDMGKFRTPTLRNIVHTGPYFHNGALSDLKDVIDFYSQDAVFPAETLINSPGREGFYTDDVSIADDEVDDLMAFLRTLTDKDILEKYLKAKDKKVN